MWEEKHCFMEMFMEFYDTYRPPYATYRDFLHNILSVYETFINGGRPVENPPENNERRLSKSQITSEKAQLDLQGEEATCRNDKIQHDPQVWKRDDVKKEENEDQEPMAISDYQFMSGQHNGGGSINSSSYGLLERAIFNQFSAGNGLSSSQTETLSSPSVERNSTPQPLYPPHSPLHVLLSNEIEEEDEEDDDDKNGVLFLEPSTSSCQICGWSCSSPSLLEHHIQRHAPNEARPHVCPECGRRFKRRDGLSRHLNIHTDLRPFKCSHCGQAFRLKQHLTRHVEARHGTSRLIMNAENDIVTMDVTNEFSETKARLTTSSINGIVSSVASSTGFDVI